MADSTTVAQLVVNGDAGMYYSGSWDMNIFGNENMELLDNIGIFTMPILGEDDATAPEDGFYNGGTTTAISAECAQDEEFLKLFWFLWDHYNDGCFAHGFCRPESRTVRKAPANSSWICWTSTPMPEASPNAGM